MLPLRIELTTSPYHAPRRVRMRRSGHSVASEAIGSETSYNLSVSYLDSVTFGEATLWYLHDRWSDQANI
jgi:hypothetical protein